MQLKKIIRHNITATLIVAVAALSSCSKLVSVPVPDSQLISATIYKDSATALSAISGLYSMLYHGNGTAASIYSLRMTTLPSRLADEMYSVQTSTDEFENNNLSITNSDVNQIWAQNYNLIYTANSIIEGVQASTTLSATVKQQFMGEAKFIRAFCYFYLVNYFGDVPLVTTTDVKTNQTLLRMPAATVYQQMVTDLVDARGLLLTDYSRTGGDRARANAGSASALLSRAYLYQGKWALAEAEATNLINQTTLYSLVPDPNNVFLKNSKEALLQFYNYSTGYTYLAGNTVLTGLGLPQYAMRPELINAFENGDARATKWVGTVTYNGVTYKFPYKLKVTTNLNTENETPLRLGEQYLIRAEARMQQSNFTGAKADIDAIRGRASLAGTPASDKPTLTTAIEHERQVELFYEWGHRWLDLKRTGRADVVLRAEKPVGWQATDVLLPVPATAISTNTGLTQNDGYK